MISAAFDVVALVGFTVAAAAIAYGLAAHPQRMPRSPALFALGAMVIMTVVSLGNAMNEFGIWSKPHESEEFIEILFIPLVVYFAYSARASSERARVNREKAIVQRLDERLSESLAELGVHRLEMLQALTAAVDARDRYTALHSMHVADYSCAIAYRLGMRGDLRVIEQAGLLHDIGKIGIPDRLLLKPSGLTEAEYSLMQTHVEESARILQTVPFLSEVVPVIRHHHERWDGTGYPDALAGEAIPEGSRILAVADAFDAMTTNRPYRDALDVHVARRVLIEGRGSQFEPRAVDALVELLDEGVIEVGQEAQSA